MPSTGRRCIGWPGIAWASQTVSEALRLCRTNPGSPSEDGKTICNTCVVRTPATRATMDQHHTTLQRILRTLADVKKIPRLPLRDLPQAVFSVAKQVGLSPFSAAHLCAAYKRQISEVGQRSGSPGCVQMLADEVVRVAHRREHRPHESALWCHPRWHSAPFVDRLTIAVRRPSR